MDGEQKNVSAPSHAERSQSADDVSGASSATHVVQIQIMDTAARPPLSRSPSLSLSEATPRTYRSTVSPISPYFQVHEPLSAYQSDREAIVYKPDSATVQETHMLRNEGVRDVYYTEEHWSSVVKSYVTNSPPKFKQVIKAYRVKSTDKLTLFVEVVSQPPALFQWFCNDRLVNSVADECAQSQNKRFAVHHSVNISTLTVQGPDQGVYSCSAQNPAGVSKSYGYITIDDSQSYKEVESAAATSTTEPSTPFSILSQRPSKKKKAPKFLNQIPHFVLKPSEEALIDVEVDSSATPVKFTWYVDGRRIAENDSNVTFYTPKPSRCVAQFRFPSSGQYTVVAQNHYGASKSTGFIEIQTDPTVDTHMYLLHQAVSPLPPKSMLSLSSSSSRGRSVTTRTVRTTTFVHRSSSLPRTEFPEGEELAKLLRRSQTPERITEDQSAEFQRQLSNGKQPQAPVFMTELPTEVILTPNEKLVLSVEVTASPSAEIAWHVDGESVEQLDSFRVLTETNRSILVVDAPVRSGNYGVSAVNGVGQATMQNTVVRFTVEGSTVNTVSREKSPNAVADPESVGDGVTKVVVEKEEIIEEHNDCDAEDEEFIGDDANVFVETFAEPLHLRTEVDTAVTIGSGEPPLSPLLQRVPTPPPRALIPSIVSAPDKQIFVPGGLPLVLELRALSDAPCTIRWYYRNFEIRPIAGVISIEKSETNCCKVTYENPPEGVYKAVVTNEFGIANFETQVLVEYPEGRRSATGMSLDESAPEFMRRRSSARSVEMPLKIEKRGSVAQKKDLDRAPKLILTPDPVYRICDGDTLALEAKADAQPEAEFQWRQNNFEAHHGKNVQIERIDKNHSRAFFEKACAGRYEVTATNRLGRDSATTKIIVEFDGKDIDKTGKVKPEIAEKEESKMSEDATPTLGQDDDAAKQSKEEETEVNKKKEEQTKHQAKQDSGDKKKDEVETIAVGKGNREEAPPRFEKSLAELLPEDKALEAGNPLSVKVHIADAPRTPACTFQWFINDRILPHDLIQSSEHSSSLHLPQVDAAEWHGQKLTVVANNCNGGINSSVVINISGVKGAKPSTDGMQLKEDFTETTNIQKAEESYSLLVKVADSLAQALVVNIFVNALDEASKRLCESPDLGSDLIPQIVIGENDEVADVTSTAPIFHVTNESYFADHGEMLTIYAKYRGPICHTINWLQNGRPIVEGENIRVENGSGFSKLIISQIDTNSVGSYECRAENDFGCANYNCSVGIKEGKKTSVGAASDDVEIETQIFIGKQKEELHCDVLIEIAEESFASESVKKIKDKSKSDAPKATDKILERRESAQKSKIPVKTKEKDQKEVPKTKIKEEDSLPYHAEQKQEITESGVEVTDFEQSAKQLAEDLKRLEEDLRQADLSPQPPTQESFRETPTGVELSEDFEKIDIPTDAGIPESGAETSDVQTVELMFHRESPTLDSGVDIIPGILERVSARTPLLEGDSRVADSSTPELLDISELTSKVAQPTLQNGGAASSVASMSSDDEAFYAQQRAINTVDFPDDLSISSTEQGQPPIFHEDLHDAQLTAGQPTHLKCVVSGTPTPHVDWFVDGDLINDTVHDNE